MLVTMCAALLALALGLAACGGGSSSSSGTTTKSAATTAPATTAATTTGSTTSASAAGQTIDVSADPTGQLKFQQSTLSGKAGTITLHFTNDSAVPHDIAVEGTSAVSKQIQDGASADITVDLKPGKYTYYCTVPGHRQAGMEGILTVS